jgi:hypothetical protein
LRNDGEKESEEEEYCILDQVLTTSHLVKTEADSNLKSFSFVSAFFNGAILIDITSIGGGLIVNDYSLAIQFRLIATGCRTIQLLLRV